MALILRRPIDTHPLLEPKSFWLETPEFLRFHTVLTGWLWQGASGGLIIGDSRVGKSWAVRALEHQLRRRDGREVPLLYLSVVLRDRMTVAEMPRRACVDQGLRFAKADTADQLSQTFLHHLLDVQAAAGTRTAVLIVDEFGLLVPAQFSFFAELYDRLERLNRSLMTVFVGNRDEALPLLHTLKQKRYRRITGRFFKKFGTFHGLRSRIELEAIMSQFDQLRFPDDGPTLTGRFLPDPVASGWRLKTLARPLWRIYIEIARAHGLASWGMEFLMPTLSILVTDLLPRYGVADVDDELLREAILLTNITDELDSGLTDFNWEAGED